MKKLAFLPLLLASLAFAQDAEITFSSSEIEPGIFMIEARGGFGGGNMAVLVGEGQVAMIDDGLQPLAEKLLAHVTETAGGPIDFMVNTHVHGDHAGGNAHFAASGAAIFAPRQYPQTFGGRLIGCRRSGRAPGHYFRGWRDLPPRQYRGPRQTPAKGPYRR